MGRSGGWNLGVSVIGFSLPRHDEYIRIGLFQMISNYQQSSWNDKLLDVLKDNVRLVDFRRDDTGVAEYKPRYCFVDPARIEYMFDGFSNEAIESSSNILGQARFSVLSDSRIPPGRLSGFCRSREAPRNEDARSVKV